MVSRPDLKVPYTQPIEPRRGAFLRVDARLKMLQPVAAAPIKPLYTRWWFWTAIGGVVAAGAVTTAVVLSGQTDVPGTSLGSQHF